jgi:hypothetical protein
MSYGYASYESMRTRGGRENGRSFVHAHCWAHARRKFVELETSFPQESKALLERIHNLFMLEREFPGRQNDDATLSKRDANIVSGRRGVCERARCYHPERGPRHARPWLAPQTVRVNPIQLSRAKTACESAAA